VSDIRFEGNITLTAEDLAQMARQEASQHQVNTSTDEIEWAQVTCWRQGKGQAIRRVPAGTSVVDLLTGLGWDYDKHNIRLKYEGQPGMEFEGPENVYLQPGDSTLMVQPRVVGG